MSIAMIEDAPSARGLVRRRGASGKASAHDESFRARVTSIRAGWPVVTLSKADSHWLSRKRLRLAEGNLPPRHAAVLDAHLPGWRQTRGQGKPMRQIEGADEYLVEPVSDDIFTGVERAHLDWLASLGRRALQGDLSSEQAAFLDSNLAGWRNFGISANPREVDPASMHAVNHFLDLKDKGLLGQDDEAAEKWLVAVREIDHAGFVLPEIVRILDRELPGWRSGSAKSVIGFYKRGRLPGKGLSANDRSHLLLLRGDHVPFDAQGHLDRWLRDVRNRWIAGTLTRVLADHLDALHPAWRGGLVAGRSDVFQVAADAAYAAARRGETLAAAAALESVASTFVDPEAIALMGVGGHVDLTKARAELDAAYTSALGALEQSA